MESMTYPIGKKSSKINNLRTYYPEREWLEKA